MNLRAPCWPWTCAVATSPQRTHACEHIHAEIRWSSDTCKYLDGHVSLMSRQRSGETMGHDGEISTHKNILWRLTKGLTDGPNCIGDRYPLATKEVCGWGRRRHQIKSVPYPHTTWRDAKTKHRGIVDHYDSGKSTWRTAAILTSRLSLPQPD